MQTLLPVIITSILTACCVGAISAGLCFYRYRRLLSGLETITETLTNIPIQGYTPEGKIFLWNRASELVYGYARKDAVGKNIIDLLLRAQEKEEFGKILQNISGSGKSSLPRQWPVLTREGRLKTMYSTMFPFMRRGRCAAVFCIDVDISDLKKYEDELRTARDNYAAVFNGVNEAIFVYDPEEERIADANRKMCEVSEYSRNELSSMNIADIVYGEKAAIREKTKSLIGRTLFEGPQRVEWLCLGKSRRVFPAEVRIQKAVMKKKQCILVILRDITEQKITEAALYEADKNYRNLLENTNDLIFSLNGDGVITNINPAMQKILGFNALEMMGKHVSCFLPPIELQSINGTVELVLKGNAERRKEIRFLTKNSREIHVLLNAWPLRNRRGEITGVHAIGVDITEDRMVMERMREMVIETVSMLSQTISVADRYTEKHCERLAELSLQIGRRLSLDHEQMDNLKYAALLHDVGKVGIPIHILLKKGKLTEEEWQTVKEHPQKGAEIVRKLSGFEEVARIIEQHQERMDGKGYPFGLTKEEIKKEASIISVVDAYDAMTSDRPYRKAMSREDAVQELRRNAGTQFDPDVVEAFIEIVQSVPEENHV